MNTTSPRRRCERGLVFNDRRSGGLPAPALGLLRQVEGHARHEVLVPARDVGGIVT